MTAPFRTVDDYDDMYKADWSGNFKSGHVKMRLKLNYPELSRLSTSGLSTPLLLFDQ